MKGSDEQSVSDAETGRDRLALWTAIAGNSSMSDREILLFTIAKPQEITKLATVCNITNTFADVSIGKHSYMYPR